MNQVQANRLVALMNVMVTIPPKSFDINHWLNYSDCERKNKVRSQTVELKCGTTACAVGWAAISVPSWKRAFKFAPSGEMFTTLKDGNGERLEDEFIAVAQFLGITRNEADYMFNDLGYDEERKEEDSPYYRDFKVTKPMLFAHCKKVLDNYGYDWAY